MKIDKRSNVPLYAQLKDLILERINSGSYNPGQQIPSELTLCDELALSRPTVRQAIAELVAEGTLVIQKGKGTFVAAEPERLDVRGYSPFTYSILSARTLTEFNFQSIEHVQSTDELARLFDHQASLSQPGYWSFTWSVQIEGLLAGICQSLIPAALFVDFGDQVRAGKTMLDILANKYAYLPAKGQTQLAVRPATNEEALLLDVTRRSPVLTATSRLVSRSEHVCEITRVVWRPDRIALTIETGRT